MDNRLSVIIASHNGERFIKKQIESIFNQTVLPLEIVVSDDDSVDMTYDIICSLGIDSPVPIRINRNRPALGFRDNFIQATNLAQGDWIAFCDQDDVWRSDKIEKCSLYMSRPDIMLIVHQAKLIDSLDNNIGKFHQGIRDSTVRPPMHYDIWETFFGFSMVLRREALQSIPVSCRFIDFIDDSHLIAHDRWAFFICQTIGRTAEIGEELVAYRQHGHNLFGAKGAKRHFSKDQNIKKHSVYARATAAMLDIVRNMDDETARRFPDFDRSRAVQIYEKALKQLETREKIYKCDNTISAIYALWSALRDGIYAGHNNGKTLWGSILKDIVMILR